MKQTAVEWLIEQIDDIYIHQIYSKAFDQAKEMEKQQIINFTNDFINKHTFGDYEGQVQRNKTSEQYYNEQFKNK